MNRYGTWDIPALFNRGAASLALLAALILLAVPDSSRTLALWASEHLTPGASNVPAAATADAGDVLQFTSAGHVLGFQSNGFVAATSDHALRVEFVGARPVNPTAASPARSGIAPMTKVTYPGLWAGITLTYDHAGILRSTYRLDPYADIDAIRLRYNRDVRVQPDGSLRIAFPTGAMWETAPIAWQAVEGQRVPVDVRFRALNASNIGFSVTAYDRARPLFIDPTLTWNTFMGGPGTDTANAVALDALGNVYVAGQGVSWGTPVNPHSGGSDAFVVKLNSSGARQWNTFLGAAGSDIASDVEVDGSGNVYVAGRSAGAWGSPVRSYSSAQDVFVAKLDAVTGVRQWNTFLGGSGDEGAPALAIDGSGNVYVASDSGSSWGTPVSAFAGGRDAFAAELNTTGALQWNTFLGAVALDFGAGIAVDGTGNIYVAGYSSGTWATPVNGHAGGNDAFAAKLDGNGAYQWNTFLGGGASDAGFAIALDGVGNVHLTGTSSGTWGTPVSAHSGGTDVFAARLDSSGTRQWHTFVALDFFDPRDSLAVDSSGNTYLAGTIGGAADGDPAAARIDSSGATVWTFSIPVSGADFGRGIAVDGSANVYLVGQSQVTWGTPVDPHNGGGAPDAFAAMISDSADTTSPDVTINQASGQADPTNSGPIDFTAVFTEPVTGFTDSDVDLSASTAPGTLTAVVTEVSPNDGTTYNVAISGMTGSGTVTASIPADTAADAAGNGNTASTSTDNTVTYNRQTTGTIVIVKDAQPNDPQDFAFASNVPGCASFTLDDDGDNSNGVSNTQTCELVAPGTYEVGETKPTGWDTTAVTCQDPTNDSTGNPRTGDPGTADAAINLAAGETVTCTFTNEPTTGTIVIVKDAQPDDAQDFSFTTNVPGCATFTLDDDGSSTNGVSNTKTCAQVPAGLYEVFEPELAGWDTTAVTCQDPTSDSTGNPRAGETTGAQANITLAAGETVTCTFTNTKQQPATGTIVIRKDAQPNDAQNFSFSGGLGSFSLDDDSNGTLPSQRTFSNRSAGSYTVTEAAASGWSLSTLVCTDPDNGSTGNTATRTATIDLDGGETVTCTFTNTKQTTPPPSSAPTCDGRTATIYVNAQNRIVGGPQNGQVYNGELNGTSSANVIVGTGGNDEIEAKGGNDTVCGGGGGDELAGGGGDDRLLGEGGNDTLIGGDGKDTMTGGTGADRFQGGNGTDAATDFTPAEGDTKTSVP